MKAHLLSVLVALSYAAGSQAGSNPRQPVSDREAVEITFDRNKGQIYALYLRALRDQPGLQGKIDLEISTNGAGDTSSCRVIRSELNAPNLEKQICERVMGFRFGPLAPRKFSKPIDFFPATGGPKPAKRKPR
jgi:periplasmic protein TonB